MTNMNNHQMTILLEIKKKLANLISKSNIYNSRDIIQDITGIASENIDMAVKISRLITKISFEVD